MNILDAVLVRSLRPLMVRAMRQVLRDRFSHESLKALIREIWRQYRALARGLPAEATLAARIMVRLAAVTAGVYRSLVDAGLSHDEARERTARVSRLLYSKLAILPWKFTALLARPPIRRVRRVMDLLMRFPYAAPGYRMNYVPTDEGTVGFDVHRRPAAEYFARQGLSDVCVVAFCNLDYPLADRWRVKLERSQTLIGGARYCDFRFRARGARDG